MSSLYNLNDYSSFIFVGLFCTLICVLNIAIISELALKIKFLKRVQFSFSRVITTFKWAQAKQKDLKEAQDYYSQNYLYLKKFEKILIIKNLKKSTKFLKERNTANIKKINEKLNCALFKENPDNGK